MNTPLLPDESVLRQGRANLQRGIETVGGHLYLTHRRLVFESHRFNVQTGATILPLASVKSVRKCWTRFLNLIPLAPNSVAVVGLDGTEHRFVLTGRESWIEAIEGRLS